MNAIADLGMNVPRDISVIGITDIQWARVSRPALTTVAVPTEEAARMSIDLLLALIEGRSPSPVMRVTATPQLVQRASTAAPRKRKG
jgi:DNA-binding LacI/PurR family transcriptional regulator